MNDITKLTNSELLDVYKIVSDYIEELNDRIDKVNNDDWKSK